MGTIAARTCRMLAVGALFAGTVVLGWAGTASAQEAEGPTLTLTPATGHTNGQEVTLEGSGFSPNVNLGVTQCSDQGDATGAGDCDLGAIKPVQADAQGNVSTTYTLNAGPFGESERTCDAQNACVLSLGELTAEAESERAVADLSFGGAAPAPAAGGDDALASTGSGTGVLAAVGGGLILIGAALLRTRRLATSRS